MKVLHPGRNQQGWSAEAKCTGDGNGGGGCGAKLLVEQTDMYKTYETDYGGGKDVCVTFKCCSCGVETDIKHVPHKIQTELPDAKDFVNPLGKTETIYRVPKD